MSTRPSHPGPISVPAPEILDATLMNLAERARVVFCGRISSQNENGLIPGPHNIWQILAKSARIEGLLIKNYFEDFPNTIPEMAGWVKTRKIKFRERIIDSLENTPVAFRMLFDCSNTGKLIVTIAE